MTLLEIVDRLCAVTQLQTEIIKEQAIVIEQMNIAEKLNSELKARRERVDKELSSLGL